METSILGEVHRDHVPQCEIYASPLAIKVLFYPSQEMYIWWTSPLFFLMYHSWGQSWGQMVYVPLWAQQLVWILAWCTWADFIDRYSTPGCRGMT